MCCGTNFDFYVRYCGKIWVCFIYQTLEQTLEHIWRFTSGNIFSKLHDMFYLHIKHFPLYLVIR